MRLTSRALLTLVVLLGCVGSVFGQGSRFDSTAQKIVQGFIAPIPGAQITVCSSAGTGTPCSPITPIYTDAGLTQQIAGSTFPADSNGNFGFWAPPGTYKYSITATGVTGQLYTIVLPINLASSNTFTGSNTFSQQIVSTVTTGTAPFSISSTTVVPNLNASQLGGLNPPASAIVGIGDTQTLTGKTFDTAGAGNVFKINGTQITATTGSGSAVLATSPALTTPTLDGVAAGHAATQTSAATNFGTALSTQTVVSSVPVTGPAIIEFIAIQTLAGVGCSATGNSAQVTAQFTSPGGTAGSASFTTLSITGNGAVDSGNNATSSFNVVKAGTVITYTTTSTLGSTGCTTTPQYTVFAKAFF